MECKPLAGYSAGKDSAADWGQEGEASAARHLSEQGMTGPPAVVRLVLQWLPCPPPLCRPLPQHQHKPSGSLQQIRNKKSYQQSKMAA